VENKIGIIAGSGELPAKIVAACKDIGRPYFIVAFINETDPQCYLGEDHILLPLAKVGKVFTALKNSGSTEVVMAGPINRPSLQGLQFDLRALKLITKFAASKNQGDDALLRLIVEELESEGFSVVGADEILGKQSTAQEGVMGSFKPSKASQDDIMLGINVVRQLGILDIGQAAIVQQKRVIGLEAAEGTDELLKRCESLILSGDPGVLVKFKKPNQDRRADLPTIGPRTVELASSIGLAGIAVEAQQTLIMDYNKVISLANERCIFILGVR
tara:strand:- start:40586 stop:41404 length:819 start_codon:yes stop_codon:yes gene_type:complete